MIAVDLVDTPWLAQVPQPRAPLRFESTLDPACAHIAVHRNRVDQEAQTLLREFGLAELGKGTTDYERILSLTRWVHTRWQHVGDISDPPTSAVDILRRAANGERFRCVEYGLVLARVLSALGFLCRSLGLRTLDVATRARGAGHVGTEVYLSDAECWVWVDPQFGLTAEVAGAPLSACGLQSALADGQTVSYIAPATSDASVYSRIIRPYLVFFNTSVPDCDLDRLWNLTLAPLGTVAPEAFQGEPYTTPNRIATHSLATFYPHPGANR